jgi:hypothetical protein
MRWMRFKIVVFFWAGLTGFGLAGVLLNWFCFVMFCFPFDGFHSPSPCLFRCTTCVCDTILACGCCVQASSGPVVYVMIQALQNAHGARIAMSLVLSAVRAVTLVPRDNQFEGTKTNISLDSVVEYILRRNSTKRNAHRYLASETLPLLCAWHPLLNVLNAQATLPSRFACLGEVTYPSETTTNSRAIIQESRLVPLIPLPALTTAWVSRCPALEAGESLI